MVAFAARLFITGLVLCAIAYFIARRRSGSRAGQGHVRAGDVDVVVVRANLIADGVEYFPDWTAAVRREFDDELPPHLPALYRVAQELSRYPYDERPGRAAALLADKRREPRLDSRNITRSVGDNPYASPGRE